MAGEPIAIAEVFRALGDPTRRALVERLGTGPATVSSLAAALGVTLTAVGQHLEVLEKAGLVSTEKMGRTRICRVAIVGFEALEDWSRRLRPEWGKHLERLFGEPQDDWLG